VLQYYFIHNSFIGGLGVRTITILAKSSPLFAKTSILRRQPASAKTMCRRLFERNLCTCKARRACVENK